MDTPALQTYLAGIDPQAASKHGGRNRVTTDTGELTRPAEPAFLGIGVPWEGPGARDFDQFGCGGVERAG